MEEKNIRRILLYGFLIVIGLLGRINLMITKILISSVILLIITLILTRNLQRPSVYEYISAIPMVIIAVCIQALAYLNIKQLELNTISTILLNILSVKLIVAMYLMVLFPLPLFTEGFVAFIRDVIFSTFPLTPV